MVFKKNFALAIRAQGKILREQNDQVFLQFGSEYELVLKNLNSVRAQVRVWIDGSAITDGISLIIQPNSTVNLERAVSKLTLNAGNKFKFIEKTANIEKHRGNRIDDGIIRVEYQFELKPPISQPVYVRPAPYWEHSPVWSERTFYGNPELYGSSYSLNDSMVAAQATIASHSTLRGITKLNGGAKGPQLSAQVDTAGITVAGSESTQKFSQGDYFNVENETHVLTLQLVGMVENQPIVQTITVQHKPECSTCGRKNKATAKFCQECGTALQLFR